MLFMTTYMMRRSGYENVAIMDLVSMHALFSLCRWPVTTYLVSMLQIGI